MTYRKPTILQRATTPELACCCDSRGNGSALGISTLLTVNRSPDGSLTIRYDFSGGPGGESHYGSSCYC